MSIQEDASAGAVSPLPTSGVEDVQLDAEEPKKPLGIAAWLSIGWLALIGGAAVLADFLPLKDPNLKLTTPELAPFQGEFILGADTGGRDMLSRLIYGARVSLEIGLGAIAIGFLIGGLLGLFSGYYRNWFGKALAGLFDILLAIPAIVLVLAMAAVLKGSPTDPDAALPGEVILIIAIGIVSIPLLARITRAQTMAWSQREFVMAARAQGAGDARILFKEILPNVLPAMAYIALLGIGIAIVAEGAAALFGASVNAPTSTWGVMINDGRAKLATSPFLIFLPILFIFLTVMSLNFLGDVVRERFDVRESAL